MFVLDCSATMAWFFEDEATDDTLNFIITPHRKNNVKY